MAKPKTKPINAGEQDSSAVEEIRRLIRLLNEGSISRDEFVAKFRSKFGVKGKGILKSFLKQRELARGWDKFKTKKSSS